MNKNFQIRCVILTMNTAGEFLMISTGAWGHCIALTCTYKHVGLRNKWIFNEGSESPVLPSGKVIWNSPNTLPATQ